ncbi:2142_t:CDS:2, partial [Scutellospora calospora]
EFIRQYILIWDSTAKPPGGKGRKKFVKARETVPDAMKEVGIASDKVDYHGNSAPTSNRNKHLIKQWLEAHAIEFDA